MRNLILILFMPLLISCSQNEETVQVLILSGSNNHDWKETTQQLEKIFSQSDRFRYKVIYRPDTLTSGSLESFDVVLNNWNSWPDKNKRWPAETEKALLEFIESGGGFVTFHASSSAFYNWPEFKNISTAAWIEETNHGEKSATKVNVSNQAHPITKGMSDFYIFDELWIDAEKNENFEVLGTATNKELQNKGKPNQPAVMVSRYGKGRIFHTILGHDSRAMRNIGFQTLLLRGTEWAASGKVSQHIPQALENENLSEEKSWVKTDSSFALINGNNVIWKFNFKEFHGKPFFHPIYVGRNKVTCVSPEDHPWHVGQWFSWKYINGVNYWEYQNGTYKSEGVTDIVAVKTAGFPDNSAKIELDIVYHPVEGENVLEEKRIIKVLPPSPNGNISMDYQFEFKALADSVDLNRTPIFGEPDGKSWGGYAGISIRFNQSFMDSKFVSSWGRNDSINGKKGDWLYIGFTGFDGNRVGSQIIIDPNSHIDGEAWYSVNTDDLPFYYFSPAILFYKPLLLLKGEKLLLKYRINHILGEVNQNELEKDYQNYLNN